MNHTRELAIWLAIIIGALSVKLIEQGYELLVSGDQIGGWARIISCALFIMWYTRNAPEVE